MMLRAKLPISHCVRRAIHRVAVWSISLSLSALCAHADSRVYINEQTIAVGSSGVAVPILADTDQDLFGFQLSLTTDNKRISLTGVDLTGTLAEDAEWSDGQVTPGGHEITWGVVLDLSEPDLERFIPAGDGLLLARVTLDVVSDSDASARIEFSDNPVAPARLNKLVTRGGDEIPTSFESEAIEIIKVAFLRGDANGDFDFDLSDGVFVLNFLFLGGLEPPCTDAADANDSGNVDLADAIYSFNHLFLGGPQLPEPFPKPGSDPTEDGLGCSSSL